MPTIVLVFPIGALVAAALGLALVRFSHDGRKRMRSAIHTETDRFDKPLALGLAVAVGFLALNLSGVVIGKLLYALEKSVDRPAMHWAGRQYDQLHSPGLLHHDWYRMSNQVTQMGNTIPTRLLVIVTSIIFGVLWRRRRFWIPPVLIVGTYLAQYFSQQIMSAVVNRGHPPLNLTRGTLTLGTYPSGGTMRVVTVWGILAVLLVATFPRAPRWFATALAAFVAVAAWVEGYTRILLLKHWLTDVIGGWVMGAILLAMVATIAREWIDEPQRRQSVGHASV